MADATKGSAFRGQIDQIVSRTKRLADDIEFNATWRMLVEDKVRFRTQCELAFAKLIGPVFPQLGGLSILDVGCGRGDWMRWFLEWGAEPGRLVGVDVTDVRFGPARAINPQLALVRNDGMTLPFQDNSFDLVTQWVCFMCIPSAELRGQVADEMRRVLKPRGCIFWWDLPATCIPGTAAEPMHPRDYWPDLPIEDVRVGPLPRPSETIRPLRGLRRWIGPILDRLGHHHTHIAARIGPKP